MYTINNQDNKNVRKEGNMFKYLYVYNYSPHEKDLCEMEFRCIFHEKRRFATVFLWKRLGSVSGFHLADTAAANECAVKFYQVILAFTE